MLLLSAWTSERLPVQPDSRCAKGWRTHRFHCAASRKAVSREADAQRVVSGGTAHRRISCRRTWTCNGRRHGCDLGLWRSGPWGCSGRELLGSTLYLVGCDFLLGIVAFPPFDHPIRGQSCVANLVEQCAVADAQRARRLFAVPVTILQNFQDDFPL